MADEYGEFLDSFSEPDSVRIDPTAPRRRSRPAPVQSSDRTLGDWIFAGVGIGIGVLMVNLAASLVIGLVWFAIS